jgi:tetraprenyl-beta-curcumene synthase
MRVLAAAAVRQLAWGSRLARQEVCLWRERALDIPDAPIRKDALNALARKRGHIDGAALFSVIPSEASSQLLRVLVAFQVMFDFLDSVNERSVTIGTVNGRQLHLALVDALDSSRPLSDYYVHHPWRDDGGYLCALVDTCRDGCAALPSYETVCDLVVGEAQRFEVLALNHERVSAVRQAVLREWVGRERRDWGSGRWYELTAGSSSSLAIHALLALAAQLQRSVSNAASVRNAYLGIVSVMGTMLDSYVDQIEDRAGDHSYVSYYPGSHLAVRRIGQLIRRSLLEALALPDGERHAVIVACMVALYLSKESARTVELREGAASLARAGGSLTRLLVPVLRLWRLAYSQSSS